MGRMRSGIGPPLLALTTMTSWLAVPPGARADVSVTIVATDPAGETVTLGRDEPFYVRVEYAADEPIMIQARPYFLGRAVSGTRTNASFMYSGQGYALGWFSLEMASAVDEVRVRVAGGRPWREWEAASRPVKIIGTGQPVPTRVRAPWVEELLRAEDTRRRQAYEQRMAEPVSAWDRLFMSGFMLAVLGFLVAGFAAPLWGLWRWRNGWRVAAAVPAVLMIVVVLRLIVDTARDPTSHNLWPFELLMYAILSLAMMAALKVARRLARAEG